MSQPETLSAYALAKLRFRDGLWEGMLSAPDLSAPRPEIAVTHDSRPVGGVTVAETGQPGRWVLEVPVPREAIGDGVQTFVIRDARNAATLGSFTLLAGEVLDDDIRAEVALLRAELDLLKRAFRRQNQALG